MLWIVVIASVIGFLAVMPLGYSPYLQQFTEFQSTHLANQGLDKALLVLATMTAAIALTIVGWLIYQERHRIKHKRTLNSPVQLLTTGLSYATLLVTVLLCSASVGLLDFYQYQQSRLSQPLTLEATISPSQLSDTVNIPLETVGLIDKSVESDNSDSKSNTAKISYGTLYPRQIWQITDSHLTRFDGESQALKLPMTVMVSANLQEHPEWQPILYQLAPNQTLRVKLDLRPISQPAINALPANAKPLTFGFDQALWLRQQGVQAIGEVTDIITEKKKTYHENSLSDTENSSKNQQTQQSFQQKIRATIETWRWNYRQRLITHLTHAIEQQSPLNREQVLANARSHAVLLGLLTGDRAIMDSDLRQLYQATGISHLLAISGPHVTMLASIVAMMVLWLVRLGFPTLLLRLPSRLLVLWVSVVVSGGYALFVGFDLPAQRTFWMLLFVTVAAQWLVTMSAYRLLAIVGLIMMWADTTAVTQAGFWLSFVAVALLLRFSHTGMGEITGKSTWQSGNNVTHAQESKTKQIAHQMFKQLNALFKLQLWLFVWMMPIIIWFFGKVSLIGLLVNLIAVPLIGLIVVPLDMLAGVLSQLPLFNIFSDVIWSALTGLLVQFHHMLAWLVASGLAKQAFFSLSHTQLVLLIFTILLVLSRGMLPRLAAIPLMMAFLVVYFVKQHATELTPVLAVLDNSKTTVSLLKKDDDAWLILSDNQNLLPKTKKQDNVWQKTLTTLTPTQSAENNLPMAIQSLLAAYQVDNLTGVISQTPSLKTNETVQRLALVIPIQQYWLAGFDALDIKKYGNVDSANNHWRFDQLTPKNCEFGKNWQSADNQLALTAVSGWQLDLPSEQLSEMDNLAAQTCNIQLTATYKQAQHSYQTLIAAGRNGLTLAMSMKLCTVSDTQLFISPYQIPLDKDWLMQAKPQTLHILTGNNANETLSDTSQFVLADVQDKLQPNVVLADQTGSVEYQLSANPTGTSSNDYE